MELAGIRPVDFLVDSSLRSVNRIIFNAFITHHPLHAMMTKYAADGTSPLAQAVGRAMVVLLLLGQ